MIRHYTITSILFLAFTLPVCAQEFFWAKRFGGVDRDAISSSVVDPAGFNYHVGYYSQTLKFDNNPTTLAPAGKDDIFFTKFDKDGVLIWAKRIAGADDEYAGELVRLADGSLLLSGRFKGDLDVDMGANEHILTNAGPGFNAFVANYNADGNFIWAKQFTGTGSNTPYDMRVDGEGSIYLSGRFMGSIDFNPDPNVAEMKTSAGGSNSYVIKLDHVGSYQWGKHYKGLVGVLARDLFIYDHYVYFVGNYQGNMNIFPENTPNQSSLGANDLFISRIDVDGTLDTLITYGSVKNDEFQSIVVTNNRIYLAGTFLEQIDIDPDTDDEVMLTSNGGVDAFILALDSNFDFLWAKHFGGSDFDLGSSVRLSPEGKLLYDLRYNISVSLQVAGQTRVLTSSGLTDDAFLTLDPSNGSILSVYEIKGSGNEYTFMTDFTNGELLISGSFDGSADFDNTPSSNHILTSQGITDCFIMHVDLRLISATQDILAPGAVKLFPIPATAGEIITIDIENFTGKVQIMDALGRVVHTENITSPQLKLPSHLSPNTYFAVYTGDDGRQWVGSFIVQE